MYDLVIIGGGPAGISAAIYAARKKLKTAIISPSLSGQSADSPEIQNWIGEPAISGHDLALKLENHLRKYEGENLVIKSGQSVALVAKEEDKFKVQTNKEEDLEARSLLLTMGGKRRKLSIPGSDTYEQKGITYCASCDGPLFAGQDLAVIGGGNAGFGTAGQLLAYAKSVTLLEAQPEFRAERVTIDNLLKDEKFQAVKNIEIEEIKGDKFANGIKYKIRETGEEKELPVTGIFVEIGFMPNTDIVKDLVELNQVGAIKVDPKTQAASVPGIWAAGDCTDGLYHQNNIAAGDAVKAVEDIYNYLQKKK